MVIDKEILQDYLAEAQDLLTKAQEDTLRLESDPGDTEILASLFRAFHTIKGGAGFMEVEALVNWAHRLENLLDKLRSHALPVTTSRIDAILKGLDVIDRMLRDLARENDPEPGPSELGTLIQQLAREEAASAKSSGATTSPEAAAPAGIESQSPEAPSAKEAAPAKSSAAEDPSPAPPAVGRAPVAGAEPAEALLRIDAVRLDAVMNQVGELVLLRNRLVSAAVSLSKENEDIARIAREMDLTVNDIQNTLMRLRMQPCKRLFQQLPRVVRDVSRQLGKEVRLEISGEDVEIDKTVVEALSAPMTHLVRNSLDHGIETPDIRRAANKPCPALLSVAAVHLGDKIRIEVADDGKGIDHRLVTQTAVGRGIITPQQAARLSEQEALELIFWPGFSTKQEASNLSGRGVGMDVVRQTVHKLRGNVAIDTRPGQGTCIAMEFPLTLAVLPVLYLRLRQDIYALPISVIESLTDLEENRVHRVGDNVLYRVDNAHTVPLVDLGAILQNSPLRLGTESVEGILTERGLFIVSEVLNNEDSVVKPIDFVSRQNWYQGATISGQGSVVLILDAGALTVAASAAAEGGL